MVSPKEIIVRNKLYEAISGVLSEVVGAPNECLVWNEVKELINGEDLEHGQDIVFKLAAAVRNVQEWD